MSPVTEKQLREEVFHLYSYHKYRMPAGTRNSKFDRVSGFVLDLKDPASRRHTNAVQLFGNALVRALELLELNERELPCAIVPSHEAGAVSAGLVSVVRHVKQSCGVVLADNPLERHATIAKLSQGGNRGKDVHTNSVRVKPDSIAEGATVLLIDDVTTTENSMKACRDLLYAAGAGLVVCIAIAKTVDEQ